MLEQRGDVTGAKLAYQRADARGHAVGAWNLGSLLEHEGDRAGAAAAYQRAAERGEPTAANDLGVLLDETVTAPAPKPHTGTPPGPDTQAPRSTSARYSSKQATSPAPRRRSI